jgi:hypothetical protein
MPSSSPRTTSEGTPRISGVMGATLTVDKYEMALSRVDTTPAAFCQSEQRRRGEHLPELFGRPRSLRLPRRGSLKCLRTPGISSSVALLSRVRLYRLLPKDPCREQSGLFPYVDSAPQHTPHLMSAAFCLHLHPGMNLPSQNFRERNFRAHPLIPNPAIPTMASKFSALLHKGNHMLISESKLKLYLSETWGPAYGKNG